MILNAFNAAVITARTWHAHTPIMRYFTDVRFCQQSGGTLTKRTASASFATAS